MRKNANYTSNNGMYIKRDKVRNERIVLDLQDLIADSWKVVFSSFKIGKLFGVKNPIPGGLPLDEIMDLTVFGQKTNVRQI